MIPGTDIELVGEVCRYIIEFEQDDFYYHCDEPSSDHIYFKAYTIEHGIDAANEELKLAIEQKKRT